MNVNTIVKRVLAARPEVQAAVIAIVNLLVLFSVVSITEVQLGAINIALVALMALMARVGYARDLDDLAVVMGREKDIPS